MTDMSSMLLTRMENEDATVRNSSMSPHLADSIRRGDPKGAPVDGGDAPSSVDLKRDKLEMAKLTHLASSSAAYPRSEEIIEDNFVAEEEDTTLSEKKGRKARDSEDLTVDNLTDTEGDDQEIERLVQFVIHKVIADLERLGNCSSFSVRDSSHEHVKPSPRKSSQDESCIYVVFGQTEQETTKPKMDEDESDTQTLVEQELDDLIRAVLEKAGRELISEKESVSETTHVQEEKELKTKSLVKNLNGTTSEVRRETGLDFRFNNVMNRLLADCRFGENCEEKGDIDEANPWGDAGVELAGGAQADAIVHKVHDKLQKVDEGREEASNMVYDGRNERCGTPKEQLETNGEVPDKMLTTKEQDDSEGTFTEERDAVKEPRLIPSENEDVTQVDVAQSRATSEDDAKTEQQEHLDQESTSGGEDEEYLSSTSEDEKVEALVEYVIDAARSSLLNNVDVFTFNKSFDIEDSGCPAEERERPVTEVGCNDSDDLITESSSGSMVGAPDLNDKNQGHDKLNSDRADDVNDGHGSLTNVEDNESQRNAKTDLGTSLEKEVKEKKVEIASCAEKILDVGKGSVEECRKSDQVQNQEPSLIDPEVRNFDASCQESQGKEPKLPTVAKGDLDGSNRHRGNKSTTGSGLYEPPKPDNQSQCLDSNHVISDDQLDEITDSLLNKSSPDLPIDGHTSHKPDKTVTFIYPHASLTVSGIGSDSDDDSDEEIDVTDSKSKNDSSRPLVDEKDWECLAIRQISKAQYDYGKPWCPGGEPWSPGYDPAHLDARDAFKKHREKDVDHSKTDTHTKVGPSNSENTEEVPSESSTKTKLPDSATNPNSSNKPTTTSSVDAPQATESQAEPAKLNNGMALINDKLRKKIVHLEQRLKQLALELTFLGDRNWRLEAYIDCLVKTLEVMGVTDVIDLDQKMLPLCLFKVKVKAGYKLGSYNGIPSRSRWSFAQEGRPAPFVDLSSYGDNTGSLTKRPDPIDPTPVPSHDDDVGLSTAQMYNYEKQLEELTIKNLILEAQLKEASEIAQSVIMNVDEGNQVVIPEVDLQQKHQRQTQLPQDLENLHLQLEELQPRYQAGLECCQYPQQVDAEQLQQQQQVFTSVVLPSQQYPLLPSQQYPPPMIGLPQQQLQFVDGQLQQQQHPYLLQQPPLQQQQQYEACNPVEVHQEAVPQEAWEGLDQPAFQDPLEWPTLSESQSQLRMTYPFANGPVSYIPQPAAMMSPDKMASPFTSHPSLPSSAGSFPSKTCTTTTGKTRSSVSCQSFRKGRLEDQRNPNLVDQSRSSVDSRVRWEEGSVRTFDNQEPTIDAFSSAAVPSRHGESFHNRRPPHRDISASASSQTTHNQRNLDRNRRFLCRDLALDSYRPDFLNFQEDSPLRKDLSFRCPFEGSSPSYNLDTENSFDVSPTSPCKQGFEGSAPIIAGLPYPRRHNKRPATPAWRGRPWNQDSLPRRSSFPSPLRSRATPDLTISDSN